MKGKQSLTMEHKFLQQHGAQVPAAAWGTGSCRKQKASSLIRPLFPRLLKALKSNCFGDYGAAFHYQETLGKKLLQKICLTVPRHR